MQVNLRERVHVSVRMLVDCSVAKSMPSLSGVKLVFSKFDKREKISSCFKALRKFSLEV